VVDVKDTSLRRGRGSIILLEGYQDSPPGPSDKDTIFQCTRYSGWLRAGQPRKRGSVSGAEEGFFTFLQRPHWI
jgi:hypothetical protein